MVRLWTGAALAPGAEVMATEAQAHYLTAVMRRGPGDEVALFNGRDGVWLARITGTGRRHVAMAPHTRLAPQAPEPDLWLVFAPLKRDATDLVVRQATELGVSALVPVMTERTNTARVNLDRLAAIAVEAAEQSERLSVPAIRAPVPLAALLADWPVDRPLAAAIERSGPAGMPDARALLVGPEGGFAPREVDALRGARFVVPLCLGPLVLRAETACVAGLALLQAAGWSTN